MDYICNMNLKLNTIQEYAKAKNVTRQTIYNWIKKGNLQTKRLGNQQFIIV